jgi:hypothetical protein
LCTSQIFFFYRRAALAIHKHKYPLIAVPVEGCQTDTHGKMINKPLPNGPIEAINCIEHFASHSSNGRCQAAQAGSCYACIVVGTPGTPGTPGTLAPSDTRLCPAFGPPARLNIGLTLRADVGLIARGLLYLFGHPRGQVWHGLESLALVSLVNQFF